MVAADVDSYIKMYWNGLEEQIGLIDSSIYDDLKANAAITITQFDTSHLTTAQLNQAQALLVIIDAAGAPSLAGWSMERHYQGIKVYDRSWKKDLTNYDWSIGELCRLLKITPKELNSKTSTQRAAQYNKYRTSSVYIAPQLDSRPQVFRDYDLEDLREDRESYPLDSRYS